MRATASLDCDCERSGAAQAAAMPQTAVSLLHTDIYRFQCSLIPHYGCPLRNHSAAVAQTAITPKKNAAPSPCPLTQAVTPSAMRHDQYARFQWLQSPLRNRISPVRFMHFLSAVHLSPRRAALLLRGRFSELRLVAVHLHFNLARLSDLFLRQRHSEHAILVLRLDAFRIHGFRQREHAFKLAVRPLDAMPAAFLFVLFELALAAQSERAVLHTNINFLTLHFRDIPRPHQTIFHLP